MSYVVRSRSLALTIMWLWCMACGASGASGSGDNDDPNSTENRREVCDNGLDANVDGRADEGCVCTRGSSQRCSVGAPSRAGQGACTWGRQTCAGNEEFGTWSACGGYGTAAGCTSGGDGSGLPGGGDNTGGGAGG